ncbi:VOC family protein [Furfurilactobacillus milii]|uniref:VOC family protein n=1 Tax=Furfurilactobacillus milii TaxID=2888272 RepID=UPI0032635438
MHFPNAKEAMAYYHEVFDADHLFRIPVTKNAARDLDLIDTDLNNSTMHGGFEVMGSEILCADDFMNQPQHATNIAILLEFNADDNADVVKAQKFFEHVANSGRVRVTEPYTNAYFGGKRGEFTDEYGVNWIVNCRPHDWVQNAPVIDEAPMNEPA